MKDGKFIQEVQHALKSRTAETKANEHNEEKELNL